MTPIQRARASAESGRKLPASRIAIHDLEHRPMKAEVAPHRITLPAITYHSRSSAQNGHSATLAKARRKQPEQKCGQELAQGNVCVIQQFPWFLEQLVMLKHFSL